MLKKVIQLVMPLLVISGSAASTASPTCYERANLCKASYSRAANRVTRLPETLAWQRTHAYPPALGLPMDNQVRIDNACFWEVSVHANQSNQLELWNIFLVPIQGQALMIRDSEGKAITLKQWKTRAKSPT